MKLLISGLVVAVSACGNVSSGDNGDDVTTGIDGGVSCEPGVFNSCSGDSAIVCGDSGTEFVTLDCGAPGCNEAAGRCNDCAPSTIACQDGNVTECDADGQVGAVETCELSCIAGTADVDAHCAYLQPVYLPDVCDVRATDDFVAMTGTIDTNLDANCTGGVVEQTGGPKLCVIRYRTITVPSGVTMTFTGGRAVALVADGALAVEGFIDVSATGTASGPGGGYTSTSGTRGAGGRVAGGNGGSRSGVSLPGSPIDPVSVTALRGGQRAAPSLNPRGGGGGGALTLISCRSSVSVAGIVDAGGGGGENGRTIDTGNDFVPISGPGGGAGGYVVLQGLRVSATGGFYSNGGGGGGGTSGTTSNAAATGKDGNRSATLAAAGGALVGTGSGAGGAGAVGTALPGAGANATSCAGGGGGSTGRFQVYTPLGGGLVITPAAVSPPFETALTVPTR